MRHECCRGDLNPYGCPPEPKSGASTISATTAYAAGAKRPGYIQMELT